MDEFVTLVEAAQLLKLSRMTVYRYVMSGNLPSYKFGRDYRIKKSELETFIESKRVEGNK